jgi:hypothetical protein
LARLALFSPGVCDAVDGEAVGVKPSAADLHVVVESARRLLRLCPASVEY